MNRAEARLYHMQEKVLASVRWSKMVQRVDFGKDVKPYTLVPITLNGRLKAHWAWAWDSRIEFSKEYYKRATPRSLMNTMRHEMVHTFLSQNAIQDGHSILFKSCCHVLGLNSPAHKEGEFNYKHTCAECGWWLKAMEKRSKVPHTCKGRLVFLVSKGEYQKLARIAKIGSKVVPVNIDAYRVMEVKKMQSNLKLKEADE